MGNCSVVLPTLRRNVGVRRCRYIRMEAFLSLVKVFRFHPNFALSPPCMSVLAVPLAAKNMSVRELRFFLHSARGWEKFFFKKNHNYFSILDSLDISYVGYSSEPSSGSRCKHICPYHQFSAVLLAPACVYHVDYTSRVVWRSRIQCVDCGCVSPCPPVCHFGSGFTFSDLAGVITCLPTCCTCTAHVLGTRTVQAPCGCVGVQVGLSVPCLNEEVSDDMLERFVTTLDVLAGARVV